MNIQLKAVAATLAGVGMGVAAISGLQGGQAKAPPAFVISNIEVTDPAGYQKYGEAAAAVVATYHGKILARGGKAVVFDGRAPLVWPMRNGGVLRQSSKSLSRYSNNHRSISKASRSKACSKGGRRKTFNRR